MLKIVGTAFGFAFVLALYSYFTGHEWGDLAAIATFMYFFSTFLLVGLATAGIKWFLRWRKGK